MTFNKILGFMLGMSGTFLMWNAGATLAFYAQLHGWGHLSELLFNPFYSLKVVAATAAFTAGLAALTERNGGSWLSGIASALLTVEAIAYLGGHGFVYTWKSEAIILMMMTGLFLAYVASGRKEVPETAPVSA